MSTVEELLQSRGVEYRVSGKDILVRCFNPDHEDRHPSMRIDRVLGVFNCFSCGYKGSVFQHYNVEASTVGIKRELLKRKLNEIRSTGIGLRMPEGATPFRQFYRDISPDTFAKFGAFYHFAPDFSGRINFPIRDSGGRIVAFLGRDESGTLPTKYKITPTGAKMPLYPIATPIQGRIILVEGIFDVLNLYDKGLTNAICCFGVSNFNEHKLNMLKISGVSGIDLLFDADDAGTKAIEKVKKVAKEFPVRTIKLKAGDPGDLTQKQVTALRRKLYG